MPVRSEPRALGRVVLQLAGLLGDRYGENSRTWPGSAWTTSGCSRSGPGSSRTGRSSANGPSSTCSTHRHRRRAWADVAVDLIQGHLSSFDFLPAWMLTWHKRSLFEDPAVRDGLAAYVETVGRAVANRPNASRSPSGTRSTTSGRTTRLPPPRQRTGRGSAGPVTKAAPTSLRCTRCSTTPASRPATRSSPQMSWTR